MEASGIPMVVAREDVYRYDALAWALLANGRAVEARVQMTEALALGTRDSTLAELL